MSKTRKILSMVLALVMVVSTLAVSAFAAANFESEEDIAAGTYTQEWTLGAPVEVDSTTYTVEVSLKTNYPTGVIQFVMENTDSAVATLTKVELGSAIPATYNAAIESVLSTGKVLIVPQVAAGVETVDAVAIDGVVAKLTYTYSGTGKATVNIAENPKTAAVTNGSLFAARVDDGDLATGAMVTGQTPTFVTNSQDIGKEEVVATPELIVKDGYTDKVVIDTNKTFGGAYAGTIYGFQGSSFRAVSYLNNQLDAKNGTLTKTKSSLFTGTAYGTGATVTLNDANGNPVATYVVIIFGDVDGNGLLNSDDVSAAVAHGKGTASIAAGPAHLAAQLHCTNAGTGRSLNTNDVTARVAVGKGTSTIDQAALAAKHAGFTAAANYGSSYVM